MTEPNAQRRRSSAEVRRRVLHEASRLFGEFGYQATTQRQIAAAAAVSTSVLFRHFASKRQLLTEAVVEPFSQFVDDISPALQDNSAGSQAQHFLLDLIEHLTPHRSHLQAMLSGLQSTDGDAIMTAVGDRLAPLFVLLGATPRAEASGPARVVELRLRLIVAMTTTMVAMPEWFMPLSGRMDRQRISGILAEAVSRRARRSGRPGASPRPVAAPARRHPVIAPMGPGRRRASSEVRVALVAAAESIIGEKGYGAATYTDIAKLAAVSQSGLHHHFGSKPAFLIEAVLEPVACSISEVFEHWDTEQNSEDDARRTTMITELYDIMHSGRNLMRGLISAISTGRFPELDRATSQRLTEFFATRSAAEDHSGTVGDLERRAGLAMIAAAAVLDDWFLPRPTKYSRDEITGMLTQLVRSI